MIKGPRLYKPLTCKSPRRQEHRRYALSIILRLVVSVKITTISCIFVRLLARGNQITFGSETNLRCNHFKQTTAIAIEIDLILGNSCGYPGEPKHGGITGKDYSFGKTVFYSCDNGFRLIGDRERKCMLSGRWTGAVPVCQGYYNLFSFIFSFVYILTTNVLLSLCRNYLQ